MSNDTPNRESDAEDAAAERREEEELAPEERLLKGWLPDATPTEGPAPAP